MGLCLISIASFFYIEKQFPNEAEFEIIGKIVSIKEEKKYYDKYVLKIIENKNYKKTEKQKIIIYVEKGKEFLPGDIVTINGMFESPSSAKNYKGFDYRKYLLQYKIFGIMKSENVEKLGEDRSVYIKILLLRLEFCNQINKIFKSDVSQFLKGLLFGKSDELSEEVKENFRISNISHILAISGMHVTYVLIGIRFIVEKLVKSRKICNIILLFFLFIFYIITGSSVSCLRACLMSSGAFFASSLYRKNNFYISVIFSLLIILILNFYNLYNIGMWLSYFGALGIVTFYSFFKRLIEYYNCKIIKNKILNYIFNNFLLTFSAQILIFPIMIYGFNTISFTFFISNILISGFIAPTLILGYLTIFCSYIKIPLYKIFLLIEEIMVSIILKIGEICSNLPLSRIYVSTPKLIFIVMYYIVIFYFVLCFYKRKYYFLKFIISKTFLKIEMKKYISSVILKINNFVNIKKITYKCKVKIFMINIFLIIVSVILISIDTTLKIYFIDVGQGDCCVIQTPKNKNIIIDGGEGNTEKYDNGKNVVVPYLLDRGITQIDYLIISHCDSDHIGGLFAVLENIKVERILIGIQPESSEQFEKLIKIANKKKIRIQFLEAGDVLQVEENIKIEVLWPIKNELIEKNVLNNNSLFFKFCYKKFSILFTGDIEKETERKIMDVYNFQTLKSTILKVANHGSKTSTTMEFLKMVKPEIALIGVGEDNKFGHPSEEILKELKSFNIKIYRTDINGEVVIEIVNNKISIKPFLKR